MRLIHMPEFGGLLIVAGIVIMGWLEEQRGVLRITPTTVMMHE